VGLLQEKDELEKQIRMAKIPTEKSADVIGLEMKQYKELLKRMDEEIREMEVEIRKNRERMAERVGGVSTSRDRLAERKGKTEVLKEEIAEIKGQGGSPAYFMTEPTLKPLITMPKCGISVLSSSPLSLNNLAVISNPAQKRAASMRLQPKVFYGKATFLPPMYGIIQSHSDS
jgi:hypothetical protein